MGLDSRFILVNELKLKSYFEKEANNVLLESIEKKEWIEKIGYRNQNETVVLNGFEEIPKRNIYNSTTSVTLNAIIKETTLEFGFNASSNIRYLNKANMLPWIDFMIAFCKKFIEFEKDEPCWDLLDVKIKNTDQKIIDDYFEYYLMCTINNKIPDKYDLNYMLVAHRISDFKLIKKRITENEVDYLLFVYSY